MYMNSRETVCLARVHEKAHKCKFVPRLLSMIVAGRGEQSSFDDVFWIR